MPIISHNNSQKWLKEDVFSINEAEAKNQDIRPLRIGFINYMPDKAFIATEKDFITPLIEAAGVLQFEVIFLKETSVIRNQETLNYINSHYKDVTPNILKQCDILIQSGFNDLNNEGKDYNFINGKIAQNILQNHRLATENGATVQVASCAASQVIAKSIYNISINRFENNKKILGVFPHSLNKKINENFITKNLNSEFNVIYARNYKLNTQEILNHNTLEALIISTEKIGDNKTQNETHLFYDPKKLFFGFQGHPEYQKFNILKEYLRDIGVYYRNCNNIKLPEIPENYFTDLGVKQIKSFRIQVQKIAKLREIFKIKNCSANNLDILLEKYDKENRPIISSEIYDEIIQSWKDTGDKIWARIFNATYQLTGFKAGQQLTTKRRINKYENPLDALI